VAGLGDFVAGSPDKLNAGVASLRGYPPTLLRIEFNLQVLKQAGCEARVPGWDETYAFPDALEEFRPEAAAIARAFVGAGGPLAGLLAFAGSEWSTASAFATSIVQGRKWEGAPIGDLRVLVAATRRTYELDPPGFWIRKAGAAESPMEKLLAQMKLTVRPERRSAPERVAPTHDAADRELGNTWYATLSRGTDALED
jgi:hypothetical protein